MSVLCVCVGFFLSHIFSSHPRLFPSSPASCSPRWYLQAELQQVRGKQECSAVLSAGHQGVCRGLERSLHCFLVVLHKDENV